MSIRHLDRGYTVVEVMVFLVVSGFILVSALIVVNGRQGQIRYEQGVRDMDLKIAETINSVTNGFFPQTDFRCRDDGPAFDVLTFTAGSGEQGKNDACVFAGKAIERVDATSFRITTIVAKRQEIGRPLTINDPDAKLTPATSMSETVSTSWGLQIDDIVDDGGNTIDAFFYLSNLGQAQGSSPGALASGSQPTNLYTHTGPQLSSGTRVQPVRQRPVYICLSSQELDRRAVITLGEDGRELSTSIDQDATSAGYPCP